MKFFTVTISLLLMLSLAACSSSPRERHDVRSHEVRSTVHSAPRYSEKYGRVTDIEVLGREARTSGGGAVLGAVIGGVLGHQIGKGTGRDVATGAGVIGGAMAGNNVEKRNSSGSEIYRVTVRFENGSRQQFDYEDINGLRVGDDVKVEGGELQRL